MGSRRRWRNELNLMPAKVFLAGYFGSGNLGDDAILLGFMRGTERLNLQVQVLCGSAERLGRNYGLTGVPKLDKGRIDQALAECDALVFPGGSILQDVTSVRSVAYYASLVAAAKKNGKKVVFLGQGIGPLNRWLGKRAAVSALNAADLICVRDPESAVTLRNLGVKVVPKLTADMAYLLPKPDLGAEQDTFGVAGMKTVGINVRPWGKDKNKTVVSVFGEVVKKLHSSGYVPTMVSLDEEEDTKVVQAIANTFGGKIPELKGVNHPVQLQQRLARMEGMISMRLHGGILGATVDLPCYMVSYDPKVSAFANLMGLPTPPTMEGLSADRVVNGFLDYIKDRPRRVEALAKRREEQAKSAEGNIEALCSALGL